MDVAFSESARSSVGIEWELALVDAASGELRQEGPAVLDAIHAIHPDDDPLGPQVRGEMLLNTVEVSSGRCRTVREACDALVGCVARVREATAPRGIELLGAGVHPSADWATQRVTDSARYARLIERTRWWGRQMLIYGVHVHVGVESRAKVLPLARAMLTVLGQIQALAASSPFWNGQDTGYASNRALVFAQLPTAGLPPQFECWADLEAYVGDMVHVGAIDDYSELRWDVRPSPRFGTLEMRIADAATNIAEVAAISAFTCCLAEHFSTLADTGRPLPTLPAWYLAENKWRSARHGMDAVLITDASGAQQPVRDDVARWLTTLAPAAARLGCADELGLVHTILDRGASYQRQRAVADEHAGDLAAVVRSLVGEMCAGRPG